MSTRERLVVIGGGFAGLNFLKHIDKKKYEVVIVDKNNYHSFPPLFYQVASSGLEPGSICFPFRRELHRGKGYGAEFRLGEVKSVDVKAHTITTQYETIPYDKLVISAGTTNNFFGNTKLIQRVFTLKSTAQAMRCRDEILIRLEKACLATSSERRRQLLSFVVVGGGPAGVEIAGALGEMKRYVLERNYPSVDPDDVSITLLEGGNAVLGTMSQRSQADALKYLQQLLVDVRLGHVMKDYDDDTVTLDNGDTMHAGMVIWTAGVVGVGFDFVGSDFTPARGGRLPVDQCNCVSGLGDGDIYAIGDIAVMTTPDYPHGHPQLAQVAIQQGKNLAKNLNDDKCKPFVYNDKGSMATVGRNRAVADLNTRHIAGFVAWLAWMFVHLMSILGMRNKLTVFIDWMWGYFSYGTSLRLLLSPARFPLRWRWGEK